MRGKEITLINATGTVKKKILGTMEKNLSGDLYKNNVD
jgi:hypothetical protein